MLGLKLNMLVKGGLIKFYTIFDNLAKLLVSHI